MRVAELQANMLLELAGLTVPPVPEVVISAVPRVEIKRLASIPVSGSAHWAKGHWVVAVNKAESRVRQRFSLAHEFKHVLDSPFSTFLYLDHQGVTSSERGEQVADYFAGCLLMPRLWVRRAWREGMHSIPALSRQFAVSQSAMQVRLLQIGLTAAPVRHIGRNGRRKEEGQR